MIRRISLLAVLLTVSVSIAAAANPSPLKVLVTNDDGVAASGIDALVNALAANPNVALTVIAPATNSSGSGEQTTLASAITVTAATTASGHPATAIGGFPGDTSLFAIRHQLAADPPDLVVSGINQGQNLTAEITPLSGTVGAATWAARLGVPAIAVSAGFANTPANYADAAAYAAKVVEAFRTKVTFRRKMVEREEPKRGIVLNINFPSCAPGTVRGVRVVATGRATTVNGYNLTGDDGTTKTFQAATSSVNAFLSNCGSFAAPGGTDVSAFTVGFATVSPLASERSVTGRRLHDFAFLERLP
jgi:5'/3'-nucleotidase SurE